MINMTVIGRLGADAVIRDGGMQKAISFNVAHSEKYTNNQGVQVEKTTWVRCTYWRENDKTRIAEYLKKGSQVYVEGIPSVSMYTNNKGEQVAALDLKVNKIELLGGRNDTGTHSTPTPVNSQHNQPVSTAVNGSPQPAAVADIDDDLPF
jgi:single-strand DNA-binding protein